ncbi:hypothetical protein AB0I28_32185 [Phytomonospora sp. NPDC050363]|uniref:hypothetical protein n=1 Tax=Phytomonospora sp. NPDC050363 TaxID=3155642 RepID=UPI0033EEC912
MNLEETVATLDSLGDDAVIHAERPWRAESRAVVLEPDTSDGEEDLDHFLEVEAAREVVVAWSGHRGGRLPNRTQVFQAVVHYAEWDSYIEDR